MEEIKVVHAHQRNLGLRAGDNVRDMGQHGANFEVPEVGEGVVVGFSSYTGEPVVYFYSRQEAVCISHWQLERL